MAVFTASASAAVTYTTVTGSGSPWSPFTPLNNDLLQTSLASATPTGTFDNEGSGAYTVLYDGSITIKTPNPLFDPQPGLAAVSTGATLTFDLNVSTNIDGYDISQIVGYGGWGDTGRDDQNYSIYYSFVGNSNFTLLDTASVTETAGLAHKSDFGASLSGVDAIRIDFGAQENGYGGYGEFDVVGVPTVLVPEPTTVLLGGIGMLALLRRRR